MRGAIRARAQDWRIAAQGGADWRLGCRPGSDAKGAVVDWEFVLSQVNARLRNHTRQHKGMALLPATAEPDPRWAEPVQHALDRQLRLWRSGKHVPQTLDELIESLVTVSRNMDDNRRKTDRRRIRNLAVNDEIVRSTLYGSSLRHLFEKISAGNLFAKFIERLFDDLDLPARELLELVLRHGIEFRDTATLAARLNIKKCQDVHNIKRRILYRARLIMAQLDSENDNGDTP
jgi:hypothetical protein